MTACVRKRELMQDVNTMPYGQMPPWEVFETVLPCGILMASDGDARYGVMIQDIKIDVSTLRCGGLIPSW